MLPYSYPDEYRFYPRDEALLAALAESSGGVFDPEMEAIFAADGQTVVSPIALWPYLAGLALLLYVTDLLLRRVRLFETRMPTGNS